MTILTANKQECISHCDNEKEKAAFADVKSIELVMADSCSMSEFVKNLNSLKEDYMAMNSLGTLDAQIGELLPLYCIRSNIKGIVVLCIDIKVIEQANGELDWYKRIASDEYLQFQRREISTNQAKR